MKEITINFPKLPDWTLAKEIGYEPKTTFWDDFSIADMFGLEAILDTYRRAFNEWKTNLEFVTELSMVLNHKGNFYFQVAERQDSEQRKEALHGLAQVYFTLYREVDDWCSDNLEGEDWEYYFRITD